jgi:Gpi18-like mannosyltransferase
LFTNGGMDCSPMTFAPAETKPIKSVVSWPVQLAAIIALAIYLHSVFWWTEPYDMITFLRPWYEHIVHYGPIGAFAHPFGNYAPAYLYLLAGTSLTHDVLDPLYAIKLLSVAGTAFAAYAVADLVKTSDGQPKYAILLFVLPSVVINAALLAQCDAIWAGACVLAVSAMIRGKTAWSLVWCGVAIAFKLQSAFIAPFIIGALIGRRAPLWQWTIPGIVFVGSMLPAWLAGWPASNLAMIYHGQSVWFVIPGRLANPWIFATVFAPEAAKGYYWMGIAAAVGASVAIAMLTSKSVRNPRAMLLLALLSAIALPFLLPKMLERYFFLADVLSLVVAISFRTRRAMLIAAAVQIASLLSLLTYMYFYTWPYLTLVGALFSAAALAMTFTAARQNGARWPSLGWRKRPWPALASS